MSFNCLPISDMGLENSVFAAILIADLFQMWDYLRAYWYVLGPVRLQGPDRFASSSSIIWYMKFLVKSDSDLAKPCCGQAYPIQF